MSLMKQGYIEGNAYSFTDTAFLKKDIESVTGAYQNTLIIPYSRNTEVEEIAKAYKCLIPDAENCIEILIGKEEYRKKLAGGYYFLLPGELPERAELKKMSAGTLPADAIKGIIYLDTGIKPVDKALLQDLSNFAGAKIDVYKADLFHVALSINKTLLKAKDEYCIRLSRLNADYALLAEIHKKLAICTGIEEVAKRVLETIVLLTACKKATLALIDDRGGYRFFSMRKDEGFDTRPVDSRDIWQKAVSDGKPFLSPADAYLLFPLISRKKPVGFIEINGITFNENIIKYEETLLPLMGTIAAIAENAYLHDEMVKRTAGLSMVNESLQKEIAERKKVEGELKKQRDHLEHLSSQLTAANKELEAFCYSVSHDLRAPLRRIDGFSKALIEEYSDKLDIQGKNYLQRMRVANLHMGQLIEDLLKLSQITRGEIHYRAVNLSALAKAVAKELQETQPGRQVEFVIADGVVVDADQHFLKIALENLLGNAWKFSRNCPNARIEFGVTQHGGKSAYFVRDNGVGFDMAFANKLFGVFQRLHSVNEFEGTGIGLATVQRIIHRHGGRIWAEGAIGQGATFYFTLM